MIFIEAEDSILDLSSVERFFEKQQRYGDSMCVYAKTKTDSEVLVYSNMRLAEFIKVFRSIIKTDKTIKFIAKGA